MRVSEPDTLVSESLTHRTGMEARYPAITLQHPPGGWARITRAADSFSDLFLIQFSVVRGAWHWIFLVSNALPLGVLLFLSFIAAHTSKEMLLYFITGNVVVALMLNPLFMLSGQLSWSKQTHAFDFYAGLPVSRTALILSMIAVCVMFTIPGMVLLLVLGMSMFHLWLMPHPLLIPLMLLSPLALSGIGATIGVLAPNQQVAGVTANLTMVVVMFLSPVFAPPSRLPGVLQLTSRLLPPTYTADGLRQTLAGQVTASVGIDLLILTLFSVAGIYLVTTRLDWRSR